MFRTVLALTVLATLTSSALAGQAIFTATGVVAGGSATSGPFVGTALNAPVTLKFEVNVPGTPQSPSVTSYAVDTPTFLLTIGAASTGLNSTTTTCSMRNNDPGVDGVVLGSAPLVGGGQISFSFSSINALFFNSTDPLTNVGSWTGGNFYSVYSFMVQGPGVFLDLDFQNFSISLPTTGTPGCFGDGSGTACPCGNNSTLGSTSGCLSSIGLGGKLLANGAASVGADTLALNSTQVPNGPGLYFQGSSNQAGGAGLTFGDGLLCAGGAIVRLGVVFAAGNASSYPGGTTPGPISGRRRLLARRRARLSDVVPRRFDHVLHERRLQPDERAHRDLGDLSGRARRCFGPGHRLHAHFEVSIAGERRLSCCKRGSRLLFLVCGRPT